MIGAIYAFVGTFFTFLITTLGAANVFFIKRHHNEDIQRVFLGFAAGVMTAASIWSLLIPATNEAEKSGQISFIVVPAGFIIGVVILLVLDKIVKKRQVKKLSIKKNTFMMIVAITIHNIPEGMAVGLAFSLAAQNNMDSGLIMGAICLAIGIGIQNYPEGTAVALPLVGEGVSKKKAFLLGSMSAVVEPVFGVLAALCAGLIVPAFPLLLALAAGTMIYVVVEELIPQAHMCERDTIGTLGFIVGFLVMMILDVALG